MKQGLPYYQVPYMQFLAIALKRNKEADFRLIYLQSNFFLISIVFLEKCPQTYIHDIVKIPYSMCEINYSYIQ